METEPVAPERPVSRTIAGEIADRLRAAIVAGDLRAGERLRQVELAARYDVSTTPVREALARLEREGLVRSDPQRGATVFVPSITDLVEHYEIRIALEELAAAKAAERFEPEWALPLEGILDEMRTAPPADRYLALNRTFHSELYASAGRDRLVAMIAGLRDASSAYLQVYRAAPDFPAELLDREHRAILAACTRREPSAAATATRRHLERTVEYVTARLEIA